VYYVTVFMALIVVIGVLIVLRTLASTPQQYDEPEQPMQSDIKTGESRSLQAQSSHVVLEEQERSRIERKA
jgi:hypothetical protein